MVRKTVLLALCLGAGAALCPGAEMAGEIGLPAVDLTSPASPLPKLDEKPVPSPAPSAPPKVEAPAKPSGPEGPSWETLPDSGPSTDLTRSRLESLLPPFTISACSRPLDLSRLWWMPEELALRFGRQGVRMEGAVVPWQRSPAGYPAAILAARLKTIEKKEITIRQAMSILPEDGTWVAEGSAMVITLEKDGVTHELLQAADGKGMWRVRLRPGEAIELWRWTAAALNGCRESLSQSLDNEELRQLLANSGEVVWRILPAKT